MKIPLVWVAIFFVIVTSCTNQENTKQSETEVLKEELSMLSTDQALIKVLLDNQNFYSKKLPFKSNIQLLPQLFKLSFTDKEGSNVEMELIRDNWFEPKPITFTLTNGALGESGGDQVLLTIGKLTDKLALRGEGYFLVNGKIEVPELSQQLISIVFEGNMVKPSQASIVENYVPVKGWIVIKKPTFSDQNSADLIKRIDE